MTLAESKGLLLDLDAIVTHLLCANTYVCSDVAQRTALKQALRRADLSRRALVANIAFLEAVEADENV